MWMPSRSRSPRRLSLRWARDLIGQRLQLRANHDGDAFGQVLVREVDVGFKVGQSPRQAVTPAVIEPAKLAFHLAQRLPPLSRRVGIHQIGDGLGGGKVELAVLETPPAELARFGDPQTGQARQSVDHSGDDRPSAMDMKLRHVLAGKAVGAGEPQHQTLIEEFPGIRNGQPDERGHAGSGQGAAGQRRESRPGERSRNPDDRHTATARRRGRREDGGNHGLVCQAGETERGSVWSGSSISRSTRPPPTTWV